MNKNIGLRFLLEGGHFVDVCLPQDKAAEIVGNWSRGGLEGRLAGFDEREKRWWAVELKRVQGIITFLLDDGQNQARGIGPGRLIPGSSGLN